MDKDKTDKAKKFMEMLGIDISTRNKFFELIEDYEKLGNEQQTLRNKSNEKMKELRAIIQKLKETNKLSYDDVGYLKGIVGYEFDY